MTKEIYCYEADPVSCSTDPCHPLYFFAYEWANPRPGRAISEVRLKVPIGSEVG